MAILYLMISWSNACGFCCLVIRVLGIRFDLPHCRPCPFLAGTLHLADRLLFGFSVRESTTLLYIGSKLSSFRAKDWRHSSITAASSKRSKPVIPVFPVCWDGFGVAARMPLPLEPKPVPTTVGCRRSHRLTCMMKRRCWTSHFSMVAHGLLAHCNIKPCRVCGSSTAIFERFIQWLI